MMCPKRRKGAHAIYQRFEALIARVIARRDFDHVDEGALYIMALFAILCSVVVHGYLFTVLLFWDMPLPAAVNAASVALYIRGLSHLSHRRYRSAGLILSCEITAYATLSGLLNGIDSYIIGYFLLAASLQLIIAYAPWRVRGGMFTAILGCLSFTLFARVNGGAPMPFPAPLHRLLTVSNVFIMVAGVLTSLFINNTLRSVIARVQEERMRTLSAQAHTDALTGLYNRRYADLFFERIRRESPDVRRCVAMLDIDDFKQVNDNYGHVCGDDMLRFIARFMRDRLRKSDVLFRWGGEEFLVVLENTDPPSAHRVMEKLRSTLAAARPPCGPASVTVTVGLAWLDVNAHAVSIEQCDRGLYIGKRSGKNRSVLV